jgi:hypothetical protein
MANNLDDLLGALSVAPTYGAGEAALDGLESGVWAKVDQQRQAAGGGVRVQLAVAVAALAMGAAVGNVAADRQPVRSEAALLSEDAGLTPSVAIEGGA